MTLAISDGLATKGPITWLNYFEDSPDFFMISDGQLKFSGYQSASAFIKDTLIKAVKTINLTWQNMRLDIISAETAQLTSSFHEDIFTSDGTKIPVDGYFTGMVHLSATGGWKLKNACWSIKQPK